jgi:cation diffusion facilitator CzcD-associated flavoprotein CzcO
MLPGDFTVSEGHGHPLVVIVGGGFGGLYFAAALHKYIITP